MTPWIVIGVLMEAFGLAMTEVTEVSGELKRLDRTIYRTVVYLLLCTVYGMVALQIDVKFPELWTTAAQVVAVTYLPPIAGITAWLEAIHAERRKEDKDI